MSRRYGQGRGPTIARRRQITRHWGGGGGVDACDVGNRPGLAKTLGFADPAFEGPPTHDPESCTTFGCPECLRAVGGDL